MADPGGRSGRRGAAARFRPASDAPVPRLGDHLRWRIAGVSRAGRRARTDHKRRREIGRGAHRQEPTPPVGRVAAAVGIRPAGWLRGCERRRSVVPRSGDALGGRRQGAHGSVCLGQPDGPLRDRMAGGAGNLAALADLPGQWIDAVHKRRPPRVVVLDMDSSESPTYGAQEGNAYNGHFGCTCYHPLFVFNQLGDLERCALRSGNVHSAASWREVLAPVVARYRGTVRRCCFRGDAAFANPEIYEFLEAEGMGYAIRLPANRVLQDKIGYLLKRPVGRPPQDVRRYYASFRYQAGSWTKPRRVVAKCLPSRRRGSSGIRVSFIRASALSSPTWRGRWSASSPSITTAAPQSSGSKRARARSSGPACR